MERQTGLGGQLQELEHNSWLHDQRGPREAEELGPDLTKGVGSKRSKSQALLVILGGVQVTLVVLHGLQRVPAGQDMAAGASPAWNP
jgi:hypothetical protein